MKIPIAILTQREPFQRRIGSLVKRFATNLFIVRHARSIDKLREKVKPGILLLLIDASIPEEFDENLRRMEFPRILIAERDLPDREQRITDWKLATVLNSADPGFRNRLGSLCVHISTISKRKALLVNDSRMQRAMFTNFLKGLGFQVEAVDSAEGALAFLKEHTNTSLLITDYILPNKTGLELIAEIRDQDPLNHIILIIATGTISEELFASAYRLGVDDILTKPFHRAEFNERILKEVSLMYAKEHYQKLL